MNVFEYYIEKNRDNNWVEEYQSTAGNKSGKIFFYTNTNSKSGGVNAFIDVFNKFFEYNDVPRDTWLTYNNNGEQKAKQWTVRMQQSKLFRLNGDKYTLTAKGNAFSDLAELVNNGNISDIDSWVLIYYFILNSYFSLVPNYIIKRCNEVFSTLKDNGIDRVSFAESLEKFLSDYYNGNVNNDTMFLYDAFWYMTFYNERDFLTLYETSDVNVKKLLADYVADERKKDDSTDCLGHKFKQSGAYTLSMMIDDAKVLYLTTQMLEKDNKDPLVLADNLATIAKRFAPCSGKTVTEFVIKYFNIFETIFNESIIGKTIIDEVEEESDEEESLDTEITDEKQDETTSITNRILRDTSAILKRMAKDRANHRCELEPLHSCRYFTSKENGKNYLEVHHLIPFEFTNEFQNSIEILDNYIVLCPHCHRLLHHGVDRERRGALTYLYNLRRGALENHGIPITLDDLFAYYGIDD